MRRALRIASFVVAAICTLWALRLLLVGGIRFVVAGQLVRSFDYWRPIEIDAAAIGAFFLAGGARTIGRAWARWRLFFARPDARVAHWMALAVAATVFAVTLAYQATTCGGSDSSGYMSQAERWLRGTTLSEIPWAAVVPWPNAAWTFTPLGYTPNPSGPPFRMAPIYAPGLPWLLAAAKVVGGAAGMSVVEPLACALLVVAAYGIGRRVAGPWTGLTAAWLMATSPILLFSSMTAMSDVPAGTAWAGAFFFLLAPGVWSAFAAGLSAALAIAIRPNLAFLAALMALWFAISPDPSGAAKTSTWRRRLRDGVCFGVGVGPGLLAIVVVYARWYGSPFESGYGSLSQFFAWDHVWPNLLGYATKALASEPVLVVAALVGLLVPRVWTRGLPRRAMALAVLLVAAVTAQYAAYLAFGEWTYLRFFLVIWALVGVAAAGAITRLVSARSAAVGAIAITAIVAVGVWGVEVARERNAFGEPLDRHYAAVAMAVSDVVPPRAVVFCFMHSGSLRYYSGRLPIRWDVFDGNWLDDAVRWLSSEHVESYAVLEAWEVQAFREHFANARTLAATDVPVAIYQGYERRWTVYIYNLSSPPAPGTSPIVIRESNPAQWRNWPAGPEPTLTLTAK